MKFIISPAKKMKADCDFMDYRNLPQFIDEAEEIRNVLTSMKPEELKKLWKCNDDIANLNIDRLKNMDLRNNLTPALLSYDGIQFQYMAPGVFQYKHFEYLEKNLRILSGFYGILKPLDGIKPYRLEMQAKLSIEENKNLYEFWGDKLSKELFKDDDTVINLASKEYSSAIEKYKPEGARFITIVFGEMKDGKIIEKGTACKMARGQMVRFAAENFITDVESLKGFGLPLYEFSSENSDDSKFVFLKK